MDVGNNVKNNIIKAIDTIAKRRIEQLQLDKTITGIIDSAGSVTANGQKVYRIQYEGGFFYAYTLNQESYLQNTAVYIQVPEGNFSKDKFILGRVSGLASDAEKSVISATANNYSIMGANLLTPVKENTKFGVYSYHDEQEENEDNGQSVFHRYNLLYQYGKDDNKISVTDGALSLYQDNATAVMVKADFMTKLSAEQKKQMGGEYGLIFSLVFKNLAAEIEVETYREVFDSFSDQISVDDNNGNKQILKGKDEHIQWYLKNGDSHWKDFIDKDLNEILEIQRVFKENFQSKYTDLMSHYLDLYIANLKDIVKASNIIQARKIYKSWMDSKPSIDKEKTISYYLSSNNMVGNPFIFTKWTSQYEVFSIDLKNFKRIDSIYLYQKGFIQDTKKEKPNDPDILVKNLQFYMMKPLSDFNGVYQLKVESLDSENGQWSFENNESDPIILKATFLREHYEDLTNNAYTTVYWFKQNKDVISPTQSKYHLYAGAGWEQIANNHSTKLEIKVKDAPAYENYYKCVVAYEGEETPIILKTDFIIYNLSGQQFILESDLGNDFSFDTGSPLLTVKMKNEEGQWVEILDTVDVKDEEGKIIEKPHYQLIWTITNNGQTTVLQKETSDKYITTTPPNRLMNNIQYYQGENEVTIDEIKKVSRIKYPMSNIATADSVTFEVGIGYRSNVESESFPTIGKAVLTLTNHKATNLNAYRLVIENGNQVFQYDEYGNSPDSEKTKDPQEILPLTAKIFNPQNLEVTNQNFRVKWFFPTGESMILQGNDVWQRDPATNNVNMIKDKYKVDFAIDKLYNYNAFDNQIICQAIFTNVDKSLSSEDQIFTQATTFNFTKVGNNGTNGTDMTAKIEPKENHSLYVEQPPTIITYPEDNDDNNTEEVIKKKKSFFNTQLLESANTSSLNLTEKENGFFKVKLFQKTEEISLEENAHIRWNVAGNTSTANTNSKYMTIEKYNLYYNSNDIEKKPYRQHILKAEVQYEEKSYYAFYSLPMIEYEQKPPSLEKDRIGINNKTYLKDVLYNNDGRNPLYSHNQGLELINLPENYCIKWEACGGYDSDEDNPCFNLLISKDNKNNNITYYSMNKESSIIEDWQAEWTKKNKEKTKEEQKTFEVWLKEEKDIDFFGNQIYILPNDDYSGNITNNYIKATVYMYEEKKSAGDEDEENSTDITEREWEERKQIATVYAPINMTLNTFGLASVNAWDGNSITLDNDKGAILAPQIAAGTKDNDTNLFTGVVMGTAEDYSAGKEEPITGLFGYSNGLRSFFLDSETGNATFGLPSLKDDSTKIKHWDAVQKEYTEIENYDEGQIKLIPGGTSVIGGWRLGRQSLYYTMNKSKNENEEYYDYSGEIGKKYEDEYGLHHLRDIRPEDQGILLSANPPYISIKSKEIKEDNLNNDPNSQIKKGDSVEIQLDPENVAALAIFRHFFEEGPNGQPIEKRERLSGLNNKGQLVANQMIQVPVNEEDEGQSTKTSLGIENFTVFNTSHTGLNLGLGKVNHFDDDTQPFFRVSLDSNNTKNTDAIYITTGTTGQNDYARPVSIHGKSISLYAENGQDFDGKNSLLLNPTTDAVIQISKAEARIEIGETRLLLRRDSLQGEPYGNKLFTSSGFVMYLGGKAKVNNTDPDPKIESNQPFSLYSGKQDFKAQSSIDFKSKENFTVDSEQAISFSSLDENIRLTRNFMKAKTDNQGNIVKDNQGNIVTEKTPGSAIGIGKENVLILAGEGNQNAFNITSNTSSSYSKTYLKSTSEINIDSSDDRLVLSSVQKSNSQGGSVESANALVLKVINKNDSENLITKLMLNPRSEINTVQSNLFYLDIGNDSNGKSLGHIEYGTLWDKGELRNRLYIGGSLEVAGGLKVENGYLGGTEWVNGWNQALRIDASNEKPGTSYGVIKSDYFLATNANESPSHKYAFANQETIEGVAVHSNYNGGKDYKHSASGYNLHDLIRGCLTAAASATATAMNVQNNLNNFIENTYNVFIEDTYNQHTHDFSVSKQATFTKEVAVSDIDNDIHAMYTPMSFSAEKDGDNVKLNYETFTERKALDGAGSHSPEAIESFKIYGKDSKKNISITDTVTVSGTSGVPNKKG